MSTTTNLHVEEKRKNVPTVPPDLALKLTHIRSKYPFLGHIFIVPKVFEPLKFDCFHINTRTRLFKASLA